MMNYARLLIEAGQLDKARREFSTLLNQNPKDSESIYALGLLAAETRQFGKPVSSIWRRVIFWI